MPVGAGDAATRTSLPDRRDQPEVIRTKSPAAKLCVVAVDYRRLWENFMPSWFDRLPRELGEFVGGKNELAQACAGWQTLQEQLRDEAKGAVK